MARPNWEYIRVDVLLPDHPKLDGLSAAAKWTLIELWCHCGQWLTDGFVRDAAWKKFSTPSVRRQLVEHGLAERVPGGYQMRNYLGHQRSREAVTELKAKRANSGRKGGLAKANAKQVLEQTPEHVPKQTAGKSLAEAEAEAEADRSGADAVGQSSRRYAQGGDDDEIDLIISEIRLAAGRDVSREHAESVRALLLNGRDVTDRAAYLRKIIRTERDPVTRFLPQATAHPSARPVSEAVMAAGLTPNGTPLRGADVAAIAAQARAALHTPKGTEP